MRSAGGVFRTFTYESNLLDDDDGPVEYRREDWVRKSDWVDSWKGALALLDKHPWYVFFVPIAVHPDCARCIWAAVEERFRRDERNKFLRRLLRLERWHLFQPKYHYDDDCADQYRDDWRRLCHGGGRASAYRDFLN
jgi:hypothetical protein